MNGLFNYTLLRISLLLLLLSAGLAGCSASKSNPEPTAKPYDLAEILAQGELRILTLYSSTSYFEYRGDEMGFEYELAKEFAAKHALELKVVVAENVTRLHEMLLNGEGDLIAYTIPYNAADTARLRFSGRRTENYQVLVQRRSRRSRTINDVTQLLGQSVHVLKASRYEERLIHLDDELGGGIHICHTAQDTITTEDLIEMVALGKIDYTVADSEVAQLNRTYFNNIDVSLRISFPQRLSWATRSNTPQLATALDDWFADKQTSSRTQAIAKRYFEQSKRVSHSPILNLRQNRISHFDPIFKRLSKESKFDWRLLAAIAYKECGFDPSLVSWAGAIGLMQIMPSTGRAHKVDLKSLADNEVNVETALKILNSIDQSLSTVSDPTQRLKLTLAAYNAGIGHLKDAQALATKYGHNPNHYDGSVEEFLLLKRLPEYYTDPVCRSGYLRGHETHRYVAEVMKQYQLYQSKIKR